MLFLKNWRTSVFGFGAAALNLLANGVTVKQALLSAALAVAFGASKDSVVTGGRE
jgi:hypothetical protein